MKVLNPFPNKALFSRVCGNSLMKTLCEKEKLLVWSNFSFPHSVFYPFGEISGIFTKLSTANSFGLKESKICRLGNGYHSVRQGREFEKCCLLYR